MHVRPQIVLHQERLRTLDALVDLTFFDVHLPFDCRHCVTLLLHRSQIAADWLIVEYSKVRRCFHATSYGCLRCDLGVGPR